MSMDQERADLLEALRVHRSFLRHTLNGVSEADARKRTTVSELTLGGVLKHVLITEDGWAQRGDGRTRRVAALARRRAPAA